MIDACWSFGPTLVRDEIEEVLLHENAFFHRQAQAVEGTRLSRNSRMSKFGRRIKEPPADYEIIQGTLDALDAELREKVNEPHEGLRKNESQWPVHQINWQKSRYM